MSSKRYTENQAIEAIRSSRSWEDASIKIGLKPAGGNSNTLKKIAIKNNISTTHFLGQGWNLGGKTSSNEISVEDSLVKGSTMSKSSIKRKIIKFNLIEYKCQKCGLFDVWQDQNIVLHLDHINGDIKDNRIDNLRFLCPNCHSQTPTYCRNETKSKRVSQCTNCGKNIYSNQTGFCRSCWGYKKIEFKDIGISEEFLREKVRSQTMKTISEELNISLRILRRICKEKDIVTPNFKNGSWESKELAIERSRKFHVGKDEMEQLLRTKSVLQIGKQFGVSDNAIRKRCKMMNIDWKSISKFSHN